ncbi:unnamed protein product [Dovyalis caffra]|uniref:Uncharacterized protein n=1 Tax=Dovyalis caffra TaxID=77055 RepID=A0AAV1R5S2_9ROSI|nr:unnamed protein product [Dovyalis caffra]
MPGTKAWVCKHKRKKLLKPLSAASRVRQLRHLKNMGYKTSPSRWNCRQNYRQNRKSTHPSCTRHVFSNHVTIS